MFRSSAHRLRSWLNGAGDLLGDAPPTEFEVEDPYLTHPHRRELRWERSRRAGSVPPRPAHCISPVRVASTDRGHDRSALS
jgi:hypothetical protein